MRRLMFDTPKFDPEANNGPLLIRIDIAMMILSFLGVCLRFYSKRLIRQPYLWDDWIIVLAVPCSWGVCISDIYGVTHGNLGRHIQLPTTTPQILENFFVAVYTTQILYTISIALTKFSIVLLYRRLFQVRKKNIPLSFLEWSLGLRLISTTEADGTKIVVTIIPCIPIKSFWERTLPGQCINLDAFFVATSVTNIATDLILLVFPIPIIWNLQIFPIDKFVIYAFFLLGGFVIVISALRLAASIQATGYTDFTWAFLPLGIWTAIETNIAIFCACIPAMRPLLRFIYPQSRSNTANGNDTDVRPQVHRRWWLNYDASTMHQDNHANFRRMGDSIEENLGIYGPRTLITANRAEEVNETELQEGGIRVEREIFWEQDC